MLLPSTIISMHPNCVVLLTPLDYLRVLCAFSTNGYFEWNDIVPD